VFIAESGQHFIGHRVALGEYQPSRIGMEVCQMLVNLNCCCKYISGNIISEVTQLANVKSI